MKQKKLTKKQIAYLKHMLTEFMAVKQPRMN